MYLLLELCIDIYTMHVWHGKQQMNTNGLTMSKYFFFFPSSLDEEEKIETTYQTGYINRNENEKIGI